MLNTKKFAIFFIASIFLVLAIIFIYKKVETGNFRKKNIVKMRILKDRWQFSPEEITISANTSWEVHIYNEDSYSHGFFIEPLEINQDLPPKKETIVRIKPSIQGSYPFYCSVICGKGHYRMAGQLNIVDKLK